MDPVEIEKWEAMEARLIKKLHELKDTMKLDMKQALGLPLSSPTPTTSAASNGKFFLPDSTCIASAQKVFDEMPSHQEKTRVGVLHVIVSQVRYPLIKEVFHQVFDPFGVVDNVYVYERTDRVTALITFRSCMEVAQAQEAMHGRCIYNGCCWMDIQLLIVLTSSNMMTPAKCSTSPCSIHNTDELTAKSTLVAASAASTTTYATATTSSLVGDILERFVQAHASSSLTQQQLLEVVTNMGLKCPQEDVPGVQWDPGIMSLIIMDGTSNTERYKSWNDVYCVFAQQFDLYEGHLGCTRQSWIQIVQKSLELLVLILQTILSTNFKQLLALCLCRYNTWCIAHGGFAWVLVVVVHIYLLKIGVMFTRMPSGLATYTEEIVQRLLELLVLYLTLIQYNLLKKLVQFLVRLSWATSLVFTTAWGPNTLLFEEVLPYIGCQELTVCCEQRRGKNTTEVTNRPWAQHEEGKEVTVFLLLQVLGGATMSTQAKEKCPLCLETMDLIDKQLKPCKCGYEICLWCWHHIMEMDQKDECGGRCPGCRSFYNKDSILGTCISSQILKELCPDKSNLQKEQIKSQKQKSAKSQLRVAEELIDPNNARVIQRKLVYIVGMPSEFAKDKGRGSCPVQRGG